MFERSREELTRNMTWIKQVVKRPGPTEEQSPQDQIGLWCSRFDRDRPAVGLLFFAGLAVRRSIHTGLRQTPRCAPGTERKRGASQPSEWR